MRLRRVGSVFPGTRFATRERFPDAVDIVAGWPDAAFEKLGAIDPAAYLAVLTHDPKLDDAVLLMALRSDAKYVGAMGSEAGAEGAPGAPDGARRHRRGARADQRARRPRPRRDRARETALSIMAERVAVRCGRDGGRLCQKGADRKRIHAGRGLLRAPPCRRGSVLTPPTGLLRGSGAGGAAT